MIVSHMVKLSFDQKIGFGIRLKTPLRGMGQRRHTGLLKYILPIPVYAKNSGRLLKLLHFLFLHIFGSLETGQLY